MRNPLPLTLAELSCGRTPVRWLWPLVALATVAAAGPPGFSFEPAAASDPDCREIAPAAPVTDDSITAGHSASCLPGIANGQGYVALGTRDAIGHPDMAWDVRPPPGGASVGRFGGPNVTTVLPQEDGWIGGSQRGSPDDPTPPEIFGWSSTGTTLRHTEVPANRMAPDFTSGAVAIFPALVQRLASDASPRSEPVPVAEGEVFLVTAGVNAHRDTLALFAGSTARLPPGHLGGRWLNACGAAITEVFDTGLAPPADFASATLAPLYDGSLALQLDGQWVARLGPLSTGPAEPAPEWLAARPGTRLVWIRHGKGYALIPGAGVAAECRQQIFLYSRAGNSCGTATFTVDDLPCTLNEINVGPDGTVVQLSPRHECLDPTCLFYRCNYSWWPRLLGSRAGGGGPGGARRPPEGTRPITCDKAH